MKNLYLLLLAGCSCHLALAGPTDTLSNHSNAVTLEAGQYTGAGEWGFYAGHNSKEQQQFGEKYFLEDHAHVLGVIAHITTTTGIVADPDFEIDFRIWEEEPISGKPDGTSSIADGHLKLGDANLGGPTVILFHNEVHVDDAFFVMMDLGDYGHDGLAGDTVGLYHAPDGTRSASDIANVPFRNVFQPHTHNHAIEWNDFYTDHTTPAALATHFALYPIVEMEDVGIGSIATNGLQVNSPYPNPSSGQVVFPIHLKKPAVIRLSILDVTGKVLRSDQSNLQHAGAHEQKVDITDLPSGTYIMRIDSSEGTVGVKFNKV